MILIELITYFIVLIWLWIVVPIVFNRVFHKTPISKKDFFPFAKTIKEKPVISSLVAICMLAAVLFTNNTSIQLLGLDLPLSKRHSGVYCYYVDAINEETGKTYTVPAKIIAEPWEEEDGTGRTSRGVYYYIEQLILDDGTIIEFDDYTDASFKHSTIYEDDNGNSWKCCLTEKHAYSSLVQETSFVNKRSIIELAVVIVVILLNWLGGLSIALKEKDSE